MPGENQQKLMSGNQTEVQYAAFLAIDWADQKHVWSLQEANSSARERGEVDPMPEAVETWVAQLSQRFAGRPIAVAVERSRGRRIDDLHLVGACVPAIVIFCGRRGCGPGSRRPRHSSGNAQVLGVPATRQPNDQSTSPRLLIHLRHIVGPGATQKILSIRLQKE